MTEDLPLSNDWLPGWMDKHTSAADALLNASRISETYKQRFHWALLGVVRLGLATDHQPKSAEELTRCQSFVELYRRYIEHALHADAQLLRLLNRIEDRLPLTFESIHRNENGQETHEAEVPSDDLANHAVIQNFQRLFPEVRSITKQPIVMHLLVDIMTDPYATASDVLSEHFRTQEIFRPLMKAVIRFLKMKGRLTSEEVQTLLLAMPRAHKG